MNKILSRVANELREGKNIIHYVSVLAVFIILILKQFKIIDATDMTLSIVALLAVNSIRHGWLLEQMKPSILGNPVKVHSNWHCEGVRSALSTARKSIVLFQSWLPDAYVLGDLIRNLAPNHSPDHPLIVQVYLLDPGEGIGALRVRELNFEKKEMGLEECRERHQQHFEHSLGGLRGRLGNVQGIDLQVYVYSNLPTLKLYVIDEREFLFGWLGADGGSTDNVCLQVVASSANPEMQLLLEKLKAHRNAVIKRSHLWPS